MTIRERRALRKAAKFIARFEGGQSHDGKFHAYRDSVGVLTQGYGHTGSGITPSQPWSKRKALRILREDARFALEAAIANTRVIHLTVNELAALTSFGFNLGTGYFGRGHDIGDAMHAGKRHAIADALLEYDMAGGQHLAGLTRRRQAERRLFLSR